MPIVSSKLSMLDVGWTETGPRPASLAALLCAAFPNLSKIQFEANEGGGSRANGPLIDPGEGWQQVADMLPLLEAVRANERMRIAEESGENMAVD